MTKIFIDPGHGGSDPGAVGHGLKEKDLVLTISRHIRDMLLSEYTGVEVKMSRDSDVFLSLAERANLANNWGADYFLSVHINAGGGAGFESFIHTSKSSGSVKAQNTIHPAIMQQIGGTDRGKKNANFAVLRLTKMPAILTENLFIDNANDAAKLKDPAFLTRAARGHVNGLAQAFGLKRKGGASKPDANKPEPSKPKPTPSGDAYVRSIQQWVVNYGYKIAVDGLQGPETRKGIVKVYQNELNKQFGAGLAVDGIPGPKTYAAARNVRKGAKGNLTRVLQALLYLSGHNPGPFDGAFGDGTEKAVRAFQRAKGLSVDGIAGKATWKALL